MELTYKELSKREVINVVDGKSLGKIINLSLSFPGGRLSGISVNGKKQNFILNLFSRSEIFIPIKKILKIGNDVILVNLTCGDTCGESVSANKKPRPPIHPCGNACDFSGGIKIDLNDYDE